VDLGSVFRFPQYWHWHFIRYVVTHQTATLQPILALAFYTICCHSPDGDTAASSADGAFYTTYAYSSSQGDNGLGGVCAPWVFLCWHLIKFCMHSDCNIMFYGCQLIKYVPNFAMISSALQ